VDDGKRQHPIGRLGSRFVVNRHRTRLRNLLRRLSGLRNKDRAMADAKALQEKAEMFDRRAETAADPISKQHYREMAAHYRSLSVEHLKVTRDEPAH
jgi:hypothetical protein